MRAVGQCSWFLFVYKSSYNLIIAVLRQLAGLRFCLKTPPLPLKILHSPPSLEQPMTGRDGHYLHCAFPFLFGPCQAAACGFHWLLEASIHLLFAAGTETNSSKPVNADQQKRCPGQVARAAIPEDRRTDNQTDRQQHHQTPSITSNLRRGEACSTRDVIVPLGIGSRLKRVLPPSSPAGLKYSLFWMRRAGIQKPAALYKTRPALAFQVNGPFLTLQGKDSNDWIFYPFAVTWHPQPYLNSPLSRLCSRYTGGDPAVCEYSLPPFCPGRHCYTEGKRKKPSVAASSLQEAILGVGAEAMLGVLCAWLSPLFPPYLFFAIS